MKATSRHTIEIGRTEGKQTILRAIAEIDRMGMIGALTRLSLQRQTLFAYTKPWGSNLEIVYQIRLPFTINKEEVADGYCFTPLREDDNWVLSDCSGVAPALYGTSLFDWFNEVVGRQGNRYADRRLE